jgi:hypothetical protein
MVTGISPLMNVDFNFSESVHSGFKTEKKNPEKNKKLKYRSAINLVLRNDCQVII